MGGVPTNFHGEVVTLARRRSGRGRARPDGGGRGGLRQRPRGQPPGLQLADRPGGVRPRRRLCAAARPSPRARASRSRSRPGPSRTSAASTACATPTARCPRPSCGWRCRRRCRRTRRSSAPARRWRAASSGCRRSTPRARDIARHRPRHDLEHRSGRDAGVREPDRPGGRHRRRRPSTAPRAAAPTPARTFPSATTRTG